MAIPWLAALQLVPWSQVIEHAPKVLAKAQELLRRRGAQPDEAGPASATDVASTDRESLDPVRMAQRVARLERQIDLQRQQIDQQTQMLGELAEQSASLIAAVELQRRRIGWLKFGIYALAIALAVTVLAMR